MTALLYLRVGALVVLGYLGRLLETDLGDDYGGGDAA